MGTSGDLSYARNAPGMDVSSVCTRHRGSRSTTPEVFSNGSIGAHMGRVMKMETEHEFTLIIDGIPELTPAIMNALFEAGCDDATVSRQGGRISLDFVRAASTLKDAIISAIRDVRKANVGASVLRVEGTEPGSIQEIDGEVRRLIGA
jgi:hypothetical protein